MDGLATLVGMRRVVLTVVAAYLLLAIGTRAAEELGVGQPRYRCACAETCWCKQPGLSLFRWVTPGPWHDIAHDAEE